MALVFQNSWLTICATAAPDSNHGLFVKSSLNISQNPWRIKVASVPLEIYASQMLYHMMLPSMPGDQGYSPLLERAWVYQERFLAPRVLHFGDTELIWECSSNVTCECGGIQPYFQFNLLVNWKSTRSYTAKISHSQVLKSNSLSNIETRWREVVVEYSRLHLTFESDRLLALAGLVAQFQACRNSRYLAGLWENTLLMDLRWSVSIEHKDKVSIRSHELVPSWSWISVPTGVYYPRLGHIEILAKVVKVESTPSGLHTQQKGTTGSIFLLGYLMPLDLSEETYEQSYFRGMIIPELMVPAPSWRKNYLTKLPGDLTSFRVDVDYEWHQEGLGKVTNFDELLMFPLATGVLSSNELHCLVLRRIPDRVDVFERIGFKYSGYENTSGDSLTAFWDKTIEKSVFQII